MRICNDFGCSRPHHARGLCHKHYGSHAATPLKPSGDGWREVEGFNARYYVNARGEVWGTHYGKNLAGVRQRWGHVRVLLTRPDGRRINRYVHGLVMEAFVGACPSGMEIRHLNGVPDDNRLENLVYGTKSENARDRRTHGTDANLRKSHCKHGHEFTTENTRISRSGSRKCRTCDRERWRRKHGSLVTK